MRINNKKSKTNQEIYLLYDFYKHNKKDQIWWTSPIGMVGRHLFSFDKKKIYNLFADYPHNLTADEKKIFDKENPFWKEFFADRQK